MKNMKNTAFWCAVCVLIGLVLYAVLFFMWQGYIKAEIKFKTESTIIKVDENKRYKKVNKEDKTDNFSKDYKEYYEYDLTWEFNDEVRRRKHTYTTETQSDYSNAYRIGQKATIYAYSNDGDNFEFNTLGESVIVGVVGTVFIVVGIIEFFATNKKKKAEDKMREVINQRIAENGSSNIQNG